VSFEQARREEVPFWLADEVGLAFEGVRGRAQDTEIRLLKDGVLAAWLESAPDDALDHVGFGFQIEQFAGKSHATYRARLAEAWVQWQMAGTKGTPDVPSATVRSLHAFGVKDAVLVEDWEWVAAKGAWFSRYWVVLGPEMPWLPMQTPFKTQPGVTTQGSTATKQEVLAVKRQVLKWKSPHGYPVQVILRFEGSTFTGQGLKTPFTTDEPCCRWPIGKVLGTTIFATPFSLGGWQL